ncbi:hypothetical protein EX895_003629 [Sporisorium graminicola]|uniref:Uncharacterized protein n=1 Tax=Sporisorium graminicola TaxID=280036 RepID=A0A4U7KVD0_9BASI|nr:hypothetical protein EX895_003629 [Sporisorium graminicola]TKY86952.1 hypothetical protein EX895_003629 [Sporisorium graminicola]
MTVSKPIWSLHGTWTRLAANDRLRRSSQALSIIRNTAYIFGGELQPRQPVDNRIDTVALTTSTKPTANPRPSSPLSLTPAPSPRVGAPSTTLQQSLYIFSGRGGTAMAPLDEAGAVWAFDTLASTWTLLTPADATAPCPPPRSYHCTASDGAHMLFIHAGCPASGRLNDLWAFDTRERTWRQCKDAPGPARGGASLAFSAGKLYRMNGFDGQAEVGGVVDEYNIATDSWRSNAFTADGKDGPEARSPLNSELIALGFRTSNLTATMAPSFAAHKDAKELSNVLRRLESELHSVKAIIGMIDGVEDPQTASVAAKFVRLKDVQYKLVKLLEELEPPKVGKPIGRGNSCTRQLVQGDANGKRPKTALDELEQAKSALLLKIQISNVGVIKTMEKRLVASNFWRMQKSFNASTKHCGRRPLAAKG